MNNSKTKTSENLKDELMAIQAQQQRSFLYPGMTIQFMGTMLNFGDHQLFGLPLTLGAILLILLGLALSSLKRSALFEKYGLSCLKCKKTPKSAHEGLQAFKSGFCPSCQLKYDSLMKFHNPQQTDPSVLS